MHDTACAVNLVKIVCFNDDSTPAQFVADLLVSVFSKSQDEAVADVTKIEEEGRVVCGMYPPDTAKSLMDDARLMIEKYNHNLKLTTESTGDEGDDGQRCAFCGESSQTKHKLFQGKTALICDDCIMLGANHLSEVSDKKQFKYAHQTLAWHFAGVRQDELVTATRQFPGHMRPDVQLAMDKLFSEASVRFFGILEDNRYETLTYATLTKDGQYAAIIAPVQYQDVDTGDEQPVQCLNNGLWLCRAGELRYAVVLSFHRAYGQEAGMCVEIAVPVGEAGSEFVHACFQELEAAVSESRSYRGKILSMDDDLNYRGQSKGVMVHRLPKLSRDEVVLPEATLKLIDRNIFDFVKSREALRSLGQSTRKGILLYGPPGTGKTHTIRYLAGNLEDHTTLIITAGQIGLLSEYMSLARLLQPALVVIEDVDLIARDRNNMSGSCEELLLNKLLNEMDGLKEDADILFVLTTNRPEELESALSARPGRIDQAIEVPLPDGAGRENLICLYGHGLKLSKSIIREGVKRTEGVSAAFIKEMMRRTAQGCVQRDAGKTASVADLKEALDDMLITGGRLNLKLLGGMQNEGDSQRRT